MRRAAIIAFLAVALPAHAEEPQMSKAPAHAAVLTGIDARYDQTADIARKLWEFAEVGYKETRSSDLLQESLRKEGFALTTGVAGIPTAFVAEWGSGGPVIGVLAEFDALPGINQDAVGSRAPIAGKG
ncbi:MAG: amidohydrolase, partial [Parvularculaceae bacterium]